jgi:hypothetical protein
LFHWKRFQTTDKGKNGIEIGSIFGAGEADVTYISPITYIRTINERLSLSSKLYSVASGSFGQLGAFGDAYLVKYNGNKTNTQWSSLVGFKSLYSSNLKINEFSLPLDYQSSLGTFDLIAGLNFNIKMGF